MLVGVFLVKSQIQSRHSWSRKQISCILFPKDSNLQSAIWWLQKIRIAVGKVLTQTDTTKVCSVCFLENESYTGLEEDNEFSKWCIVFQALFPTSVARWPDTLSRKRSPSPLQCCYVEFGKPNWKKSCDDNVAGVFVCGGREGRGEGNTCFTTETVIYQVF